MSFKVRINQLATKKVPAISLVLIASIGMVAGVLAATMVVNQNTRTGEQGTYHNNTGVYTISDQGLGIAANAATDNSTSVITIGSTGIALNNAIVAGHWIDTITFVDSSPATGTHTVTIATKDGLGPAGSTLVSITSGTWTTSTSSTGTVTFYVDLGTTSLTAPLTVYVNVT